MSSGDQTAVRLAEPVDAPVVARLLRQFNAEYDEPAPPQAALARRVRELMARDTTVLLAGAPPCGLALLRIRQALWSAGNECYLAEFYVQPGRRGQGLGAGLLAEVLRTARSLGADTVDVNTATDDTAARALYERFGFRNAGTDGEQSLYYERELADPGRPGQE